ncbi:hypothetical protein [Azonexus fungiphilus]|uniref:hypothetical protein n=1 Tax=Azonexus fungiphilus TaxID=146940 RepID=UPI0011C44668|nr:hypothetical protein [Azonexus fungiphilus]
MPETVFVPLKNEGTIVWRPVAASACGVNVYRLGGISTEGEEWQFPPDALVRCESRRFSDGTTGLAEVALAEPEPPSPLGATEKGGWYCPAVQKVISAGLCWEYCFADLGGPTDTAAELKAWIAKSGRLSSLSEFHEVCHVCPHCQWSKE